MNANKEVVFDIETIGDIKQFDSLEVTVVSIYQYETDSYRSFEKHELKDLWPIFESAERLIGYNSLHFDLPVLAKYYQGDLTHIPHLDMLKVVKEMSGSRYKLNDLAKATLQMEKSADGLQAMQWFAEGKLDEIKKYCEQDVKVTKELYEYGRKNKMLYYNTLTGELRPLPVNFDPAPQVQGHARTGTAPVSRNMTLPF